MYQQLKPFLENALKYYPFNRGNLIQQLPDYRETGLALAQRVTRDLQQLTNDTHISVSYGTRAHRMDAELLSANGGVSIQGDTITIISFEPLWNRPATKLDIVKRFTELVARRPRTITVDMRQCPGGDIETLALLCSFFVPEGELMFRLVETDKFQDFKSYPTHKFIDHKHRPGIRVRVGPQSFSAAYTMAYVLRNMGARIEGRAAQPGQHVGFSRTQMLDLGPASVFYVVVPNVMVQVPYEGRMSALAEVPPGQDPKKYMGR